MTALLPIDEERLQWRKDFSPTRLHLVQNWFEGLRRLVPTEEQCDSVGSVIGYPITIFSQIVDGGGGWVVQ